MFTDKGHHRKAQRTTLTPMLSGIIVEPISGRASEGFDDLIGERWKVVFQFSIVEVVH